MVFKHCKELHGICQLFLELDHCVVVLFDANLKNISHKVIVDLFSPLSPFSLASVQTAIKLECGWLKQKTIHSIYIYLHIRKQDSPNRESSVQ